MVPKRHLDTLSFLRRVSSTLRSFPSPLITGKLQLPKQVQWEPVFRSSESPDCLLRGDHPKAREMGPGAMWLACSTLSITQPSCFLQCSQDLSPCSPSKNFQMDKNSLLLSPSAPIPAGAASRLSPGGGETQTSHSTALSWTLAGTQGRLKGAWQHCSEDRSGNLLRLCLAACPHFAPTDCSHHGWKRCPGTGFPGGTASPAGQQKVILQL